MPSLRFCLYSWFLGILIFWQCQEAKPSHSVFNENKLLLAAVVLANQKPEGAFSSECGLEYKKENSLFNNYSYYDTFLAYKTGVKNLVIGDSTMDISARYNGFLSNDSKSTAVSGNTLCDMYMQDKKLGIPFENVIISTGGGNDLLQRVSVTTIESVGSKLLNHVQARNQGKLVLVGIHPTRVDYANSGKGEINKRMENLTTSLGGCYYDPAELFTLDEAGRASESNMLDSIHYNETISFQIKSKISSQCNLDL